MLRKLANTQTVGTPSSVKPPTGPAPQPAPSAANKPAPHNTAGWSFNAATGRAERSPMPGTVPPPSVAPAAPATPPAPVRRPLTPQQTQEQLREALRHDTPADQNRMWWNDYKRNFSRAFGNSKAHGKMDAMDKATMWGMRGAGLVGGAAITALLALTGGAAALGGTASRALLRAAPRAAMPLMRQAVGTMARKAVPAGMSYAKALPGNVARTGGIYGGMSAVSGGVSGFADDAEHLQATGERSWKNTVQGAIDGGVSGFREGAKFGLLPQFLQTPAIVYEQMRGANQSRQYGAQDFENMPVDVGLDLQLPDGLVAEHGLDFTVDQFRQLPIPEQQAVLDRLLSLIESGE